MFEFLFYVINSQRFPVAGFNDIQTANNFAKDYAICNLQYSVVPRDLFKSMHREFA